MKPVVIIVCILGSVSSFAGMFQSQPLAQITPPWEMAEYRFEDLNRDRVDDLLVIGKQGQIQIWSCENSATVRYAKAGEPWRLPSPKTSLLSLASLSDDKEDKVLIALTPKGLFVYPIHGDATIDPEGKRINRRMKFALRVGKPVFSNFMQDINQDGKLDVLVPKTDGCEIWINKGVAGESTTAIESNKPIFSRMGRFPLKMSHGRQTDMRDTKAMLSENIKIPNLVLKDVNGDDYQDLVVKQGSKRDYYLLKADGHIPEKPTVSLDLSLFQDTTPDADDLPFGETLSMGGGPQLTESDLNNDGIGDYVIAHKRKLWFFHGSDRGPQFTDPTSIVKIAEDISSFLVSYLDEDDYPDLLMIKVRVPTLAKIMQGLFIDWQIKIESIGYQSKQGLSFELSSTWQGDLFLRLPAILSLITNPDQLKELEVEKEYWRPQHGDFNGDGRLDVTMARRETGQYEFWFGQVGEQEIKPQQDDPKELGAKLRKLLFAKSDNVWDIPRIKKALNALANKQVSAVTGGRNPDFRLDQFTEKQAVGAECVDFDHDGKDELLYVYMDPQAEDLTVFELITITGE